jgi:multimeric flavodoxin WrbA
MKITSVLGSPRTKGNSATLAREFCDAAGQNKAEVREFVLNKLNFKGCQGCMACKAEKEKCVVQDDLTEVLEAVRETDILVLASPVYYADVTAQMKAFVDRTFSFLKPDFETNPDPSRLEKGKTLVFIQTQGDENEGTFAKIFPKYEMFFLFYGFGASHLIRACGINDLGEVRQNKDVMSKARELAQTLTA